MPALPQPVRKSAAAVLLAAGESSRMGSAKQLLDWRGMPLLSYQVSQLLEVPEITLIAVVLGHRADEFLPLVARGASPSSMKVITVVNPRYREGKSTSVRTGLERMGGFSGSVLVLAVDQPRPAGLLRRLVQEHLSAGNLISVPSFEGRRGHPPVFDGSLIPELLLISEEREGMREVLEAHGKQTRDVQFDTPLVLANLNSMEDYRRARLMS